MLFSILGLLHFLAVNTLDSYANIHSHIYTCTYITTTLICTNGSEQHSVRQFKGEKPLAELTPAVPTSG